MEYAHLYDLFGQANSDTNNQWMAFSYSSWKYCRYTGRSTRAYHIFYQGRTIDHGTHVAVPVSQSSAESEYNAACTAAMYLTYFRMLSH